MTVWIYHPDRGPGSPEFLREAVKLEQWLDDRGVGHCRAAFDGRGGPATSQIICDTIEAQATRLDAVVFLCHGGKTWLQPGFGRRGFNIAPQRLGHALSYAQTRRLVLFACSTAGGAGPMGDLGFADKIRDTVDSPEFSAWGHVGPGHTTRRPYLRVFSGQEAEGGRWAVVPPGRKGLDGSGPAHGYDPVRWAVWKQWLARGGNRFEVVLGDPVAAFEPEWQRIKEGGT